MDMIKKPVYAIIDSGVFGLRIVSGIVTGIRYTETDPVYTIQFGKDSWTSSQIAETKEDLIEMFELPELKRIEETHGLKIKYGS